MYHFFSIIVARDGRPLTEIRDEAIPLSTITELHNLQANDGLTLEDAITFLRQSLVPAGYQPYPFKVDKQENLTDKLKSLVATYHYRHRVGELKEQGVDTASERM